MYHVKGDLKEDGCQTKREILSISVEMDMGMNFED